jgi:hypothetical protein
MSGALKDYPYGFGTRFEGKPAPIASRRAAVRSLRIGTVKRTPPLDMLLRRDLDPVVYFNNYDDLSNSPGQIVADVASGKLDVALVWGPIGGYFARRQPVPLQAVAFEELRSMRSAQLTAGSYFSATRGTPVSRSMV